MARIGYNDGQYRPLRETTIRAEDRGYQFADGIYEVWALRKGRLLDAEEHFARLEASLKALDIPMPMPRASLQVVICETIRRNRIRNGLVYCQITRGVAPRDHAYGDMVLKPILTVTARPIDMARRDKVLREGIKIVTAPDLRWKRCDIKSIGLLPNVLARQAAKQAGADDAWLVDEAGFITEGTAANAWIVDSDGALRTRAAGNDILNGVTRQVITRLATEHQIRIVEKPFTPDEIYKARECFATASTLTVIPITHCDGHAIGNGKTGTLAKRISQIYDDFS